MARKAHPNKDIEEALQYAESKGWRAEKSKGKNAHAWGQLYCPTKDEPCTSNGQWCIRGIWSTPRSAGNHAGDLKRKVDGCLKQKIKQVKDDE